MYRDGIELRTEDRINFLLVHGALGDAIASLPAICWARKMHSLDMDMVVWVARIQVPLLEHLIGGPGLRFEPLDDFQMVRQKGDERFAGSCVINSIHHNHVTRNRFDLVDFAFATMIDRQPDSVAEKCYPHWAPLGPRLYDEPYVVLPVGSTNEASVFHPKVLTPVIEWLLAVGYQPVLTGAKNTYVHMLDKGKPELLVVRDRVDDVPAALIEQCTDLRDKTTLLEVRDWCGHANAVVGIDGGTLHLAGTTDAPIVYGTTRVDARHRGIARHGEMNWNLQHVKPRDLECAGCQSNWSLMFGHNFRNCGYNDFKCVEQLHADDFINAMKQLGL